MRWDNKKYIWSAEHPHCIVCKKTSKPHNARGMCKSCYYKTNEAHEAQKKYRDRIKFETLKHYSGGKPVCNCCGETEIMFLGIDHINGCGAKRRKKEPSGSPIIIFLRARNYPKGYQVLCHNCNMAKGHFGRCPHEKKNK